MLDLPVTERGAWLARLQADDAPVKPWLERLLRSSTAAESVDFMVPPLIGPEGDTWREGDQVGPYQLRAPLGYGGMGVVWRASRADDGPAREVALKLPHAEMLSGPFRSRFRRERDVLAGLNHPHIAALYDAGITLDGHPYMALELVTGQPITAACTAAKANLQRRITLIEQVLDALSYAHQRLIVHRDIKPSNVLVTPEGGVKLLDFGIAKLLRGTDTEATQLTQAANRMATPGYGAPEQMAGGDITVAADLFSVGVLAFELCTGQLPFLPVPLAPNAAPAPLASRIAASRAGHKPMAAALRGDLDAIIAKALSLDAAGRYISADAFARDLRRWRQGLPVSARRIGWVTQARKFAARNRAGVAMAAVLALALLGGSAGIAWQAERATREAARANAIKDFMVGLFGAADAGTARKPSLTMTAKELLDIGADRADAAFAKDPGTEIELLDTLGGIYDELSDAGRAEQVRARKLALARAVHGPAAPDVIADTIKLANTEVLFLREDHARALLEGIRAPVFQSYGAQSLERALWLSQYAHTLRATHGGRDMAIQMGAAAIRIFAAHFPNDPGYADALNEHAGFLYDAEDYAGAIAALDQARAAAQATNQYDAMDEVMYLGERAGSVEHLGRLDEADQMLRDLATKTEKSIGRDSTFYTHARIARAGLLHLRGARAEADAIFEEMLGLLAGSTAPTGGATSTRRAYGAALAREGRVTAAIPVLERALAETRLHPRDEANLRRSMGYLGDAYAQLGRAAQAGPLLQAARDDWMRYGAPQGVQLQAARERWARFLASQGENTAAEAEFQAVVRIAGRTASAPAALAQAGLARLALTRGDAAGAERFSLAALQTLAAATLEYDVRSWLDVWLARAEVLRARGDAAGAHDMASKALERALVWDVPESPAVGRLRDFLRGA